MSEVKRGRGRPKGSETDDSAPLMMVARLLTDDPRLAAKTAMRRVFRGGSWGRSSEEASIHRWQGKWRISREAYLRRVQDERAAAEAERQRREREAVQTFHDSARAARDLAAGIGALWHSMPREAVGWAVFGILHQHREMAQTFGGAIASLAERRMLSGQSSAFEALARSKAVDLMTGRAVADIWNSQNTRQLGEAMRKYDTLGRTMERFAAIPGMKFPR